MFTVLMLTYTFIVVVIIKEQGCDLNTFTVLAIRSQFESRAAGAVIGPWGILASMCAEPARVAPTFINICQERGRFNDRMKMRYCQKASSPKMPFIIHF